VQKLPLPVHIRRTKTPDGLAFGTAAPINLSGIRTAANVPLIVVKE
jgi:hypothetical protein